MGGSCCRSACFCLCCCSCLGFVVWPFVISPVFKLVGDKLGGDYGISEKSSGLWSFAAPWLWSLLLLIFYFLRFMAFIALNMGFVYLGLIAIASSRGDMRNVIKPFSAKVRQKKLIFSKYMAGLIGYYALILADLAILCSGWLSPNLRIFVLLQFSILIQMGLLAPESFTEYGTYKNNGIQCERVLIAGTILTFGINIALYHLILA